MLCNSKKLISKDQQYITRHMNVHSALHLSVMLATPLPKMPHVFFGIPLIKYQNAARLNDFLNAIFAF